MELSYAIALLSVLFTFEKPSYLTDIRARTEKGTATPTKPLFC